MFDSIVKDIQSTASRFNPANVVKDLEELKATIEAFEKRIVQLEAFVERTAPAIRAIAVMLPGPLPTEVSLLLADLPKAADTTVNVLKTVDATLNAESPTPAKIETVPNPAQGSASVVPNSTIPTLPVNR